MKIFETEIPDVVIIEPNIIKDERGFFMEVYKKEWFINSGIPFDFVQENHSLSIQNTLRGLHYQVSHTQGKLVRAIAGVICDVAVDLRRKSKFFGKSVVRVLSDENKHLLWIPPGFAHGFYVISRSAEVIYKTTDYYDSEGERQIRWNDPELAIHWSIPTGQTPLLSEKDNNAPLFKDAEVFP